MNIVESKDDMKEVFKDEFFCKALVDWIISDDQSFLVVENQFFKYLLCLLKPDIKILTADTIKNDIMKTFINERERIKKELQKAPGKISFTLDIWTSSNHLVILSINIY